MKRRDKKFGSNSSLWCCSEHFSEKDYRKSLTGKRRDLVKNVVPFIFPWSVGNDEASERSESAKVGNAKGLNFQRSHPTVSKGNITHTMHLTSLQGRLETKIQVINHSKKRETWLPRIMILNKSCLFQNVVCRGLDRMMMTFFYTGFQSYRALMAFWNFIRPCSDSLMSWNTAREKVKESSANSANPFPFLQGQEKKKEIKREK